MLKRVHHINFLVRDLDRAIEQYERLFGLVPVARERLPGRAVETARFRVGEVWIVLVQPSGDEGVPARHLREHGEGFFLISFEVEDLDRAAEILRDAATEPGPPRTGLSDWRVMDLDPADTFGAVVQLTEGASATPDAPDGPGSRAHPGPSVE